MNKLALITGAGRGLGYALVEKHLSLGDEVYAYELFLSDELDELNKIYPDKLHIAKCDISSTESVNIATLDLLKNGRQLDYIYNVAGIFLHSGKVGLAETDLDEGLVMYDVNGVGLLRICKAVFGLIGKGTVIANITSEAGSITNCYRSAEYMYSISKAAANMASKILSNEVYPLGARVICFHPGWLRTQMGGIDAKTSERGVEPADSAEQIIDKVINIDKIPASWIFMEQTGALLPW